MEELLINIKAYCGNKDKCLKCGLCSLCNVSPCCWSEEDIKDIVRTLERIKGEYNG